MRIPTRGRELAWAGVAGPVTFIASWATAGALTEGYSPLQEPISRLAAAGAAHRPLMNAGFLVFAAAMPAYAVPLRSALPGRAWLAAVVCGVGSAGIAATPLGFSDGLDSAHAVAAGSTYVAMAALPLLAAGPLARAGRRRAARVSGAAGVVAGACLAASIVAEPVGLFQRAGLTLIDAWIVAGALAILRGRRE
jgi:hypothetical membrane protein